MLRGSWWLLIALLFAPPVASAQIHLAPQPPPERSWPRFECEDGTCPDGVGALLAYRGGGQVGFCTATLVAPDRIVTAAHCVAGPGDALHFFLPDEHAITIQWRAVTGVVHRETREVGADHALLSLARSIDGPHARLARTPPAPESRLTVVRASPHRDRTVFVRSDRCIVMPRALTGRAEPSAIVRVAGCTILPGNSGAPLLDRRGRVVAVVSSAIDPDGVHGILAPWLEGPAPFVGTMSSLACVPRPFAPGGLPAVCARRSREPDPGMLSRTEARDAAIQASREALADRLIQWDADDGHAEIGWDLERHILDDRRTVGVPVPACIDVAALDRARRIDRRGRFTLRADVPAWEASSLLGEGMRMIPRTERIARIEMTIRGRLDDTRRRAHIRVRVRGTGLPIRSESTIPACAP